MLTAGLLARRVITFCPPSRIQENLRPVASGQTARRLQLRGQPRLDPADMPNRPRSLLIPPLRMKGREPSAKPLSDGVVAVSRERVDGEAEIGYIHTYIEGKPRSGGPEPDI